MPDPLQGRVVDRREPEVPPLTFKRFQDANAKRCPEAFDHALSGWSLLEWAGAMCGEAGEAANVCKKILRKRQGVGGSWAARDPEEDSLVRALGEEIGDVLAYLALLASAAGLDMGRCAAETFDAISVKAGWDGERLVEIAPADGVEAEEHRCIRVVVEGLNLYAGDEPLEADDVDTIEDAVRMAREAIDRRGIQPASESPSEAERLLREIHENRTMRHYDSAMHDRIGQHLDALSAARRAREEG